MGHYYISQKRHSLYRAKKIRLIAYKKDPPKENSKKQSKHTKTIRRFTDFSLPTETAHKNSRLSLPH
jgi:hypothetical protein